MLAGGQATQNAFVFANVIWDVAHSAEIGFEIGHRDTDYKPSPMVDTEPGDNKAMIYRTRVLARF